MLRRMRLQHPGHTDGAVGFDHFDTDSSPKRFGKYMVGHALPWELNKIKLRFRGPTDKFFVYPLTRIPEDVDDIWVCEDEESDFA